MNILIIGLGVIGSTYGYLFQKAGHSIEHLLRNESKKATFSEIRVDLFDGRTNQSGEWKHDIYHVKHANKDEIYDFLFVSVPSGGIADVLRLLKENNIKGTIILACGIWEDRQKLDKLMKGWEYILGYPVAGGNMSGQTLNCCVFDHFMLERAPKANIKKYALLTNLFSDCNIKLECPYDMLEWIWIHMAINAGVITVAGNYGDIKDTSKSAEQLMDSSQELTEAVLSIRETSKIIASRGVDLKKYKNELLPYKIPSKLAGVVMRKMFAGNLLTRKIMTLHSNLGDLLFVCSNVYECGRQHAVKAPIFNNNYEAVQSQLGR